VPPKNMVRKLEIPPAIAAERRMKAGGVAITDQRMNSPTPVCSALGGSCTTSEPPSATPASEPSTKGSSTP